MAKQSLRTVSTRTPIESAKSVARTRGQRGIQSIEVGGQLLHALAHHGRPLALKELALAANMAPAKAHPYLVSFGKIGLVEQDTVNSHYGLGPLALQLGLMSLQQADPVRIATPLLLDLASKVGHTVALAVLGTRGPTIVRLEESPAAVHVNMRHGTVFSISDTATGLLFAAYLPEPQVRHLLGLEQQAPAPDPLGKSLSGATSGKSWRALQRRLDEVRSHGLSRSEGTVVRGVSAVSAPVFDHTGAIVLALTAIGPSAALDVSWKGKVAQALKASAQDVSLRLGYRIG